MDEVSDAEWEGDSEVMTEFKRARMNAKWPVEPTRQEIVLPNLHTPEIYPFCLYPGILILPSLRCVGYRLDMTTTSRGIQDQFRSSTGRHLSPLNAYDILGTYHRDLGHPRSNSQYDGVNIWSHFERYRSVGIAPSPLVFVQHQSGVEHDLSSNDYIFLGCNCAGSFGWSLSVLTRCSGLGVQSRNRAGPKR